MKPPKDSGKLETEVLKDVARIKEAERNRNTVLSQTVYLGTLGVVIVLPIVVGAYLGHWLDCTLSGFSFSWTVCLIVLGAFVGGMNAYFFVRRGES